jgi:hypothetical protein
MQYLLATKLIVDKYMQTTAIHGLNYVADKTESIITRFNWFYNVRVSI